MSKYPQPATPLPWPRDRIRIARPESDVAYAIHTANAFPALVAALEVLEKNWRDSAPGTVAHALAIARGDIPPPSHGTG